MRTRMTGLGGLLVLALGLLVLSGCNSSLKQTNPALPPGFAEAKVPAGDISAYIYSSQGSPVSIPTDWFGNVENAGQSTTKTFVIPHVLEVSGLSLWAGPTVDSNAATIEFADNNSATVANGLLSSVPNKPMSWVDGSTLNVVRGKGDWSTSMESAMKSGQGSTVKDAYPSVWDLLHVMPENPPGKPVAAGFARVNAELMDSLSAQAGLDMQGLGQAFGAINVQEIAVIAYADGTVKLPKVIGPDYFKEQGLSALFVARSTYPGFVLSFFLGSFSDRIGLEKGPKVKGQDVMVKELQGAHLMLAPLGNTFFLVVAPTKEQAEALMSSALAPHGQE